MAIILILNKKYIFTFLCTSAKKKHKLSSKCLNIRARHVQCWDIKVYNLKTQKNNQQQ